MSTQLKYLITPSDVLFNRPPKYSFKDVFNAQLAITEDVTKLFFSGTMTRFFIVTCIASPLGLE